VTSVKASEFTGGESGPAVSMQGREQVGQTGPLDMRNWVRTKCSCVVVSLCLRYRCSEWCQCVRAGAMDHQGRACCVIRGGYGLKGNEGAQVRVYWCRGRDRKGPRWCQALPVSESRPVA